MSEIQRILFIDAYDSFTRNIVALLYQCIPFADVTIIHIDSNIKLEYGLNFDIFVTKFDAIVLGPGPGDPRNQNDIGLFQEAFQVASDLKIPLLGICLGFQALCLRYGYRIIRMKMPCHGHAKAMKYVGDDMFAALSQDSGLIAVSYNSLAVKSSEFSGCQRSSLFSSLDFNSRSLTGPTRVPTDSNQSRERLQLLAWDDDGYAMAARHASLPLWGVQFHPESCLSSGGEQVVRNWWMLASSHKARHGPFEHSKNMTSQPAKPLNQQKPARSLVSRRKATPGQVTWRMTKLPGISSQHLSEICHRNANKSCIAMLESVSKGRYCIYGFTDATSEVISYAEGILKTVIGKRVVSRKVTSPFEALRTIEDRTKAQQCDGGCPTIPFWGGWIGFLSYEIGLDLIGVAAPDERIVPDFSFVFVDRSIVLDQKTGNVCIQSIRRNDEAWVLEMKHTLMSLNKSNSKIGQSKTPCLPQTFLARTRIARPDRDTYQESYTKCNEHLHAGNSYELCLTSEAQVDMGHSTPDNSYLLYQNLIKHNPVPFAAFLHFPGDGPQLSGTTLLSTSPEQFLSCSRTGTMDMIPMKGTVQRSQVASLEDAYRILYSPKETAENLMIADLIRHDLYSVVGCKPYSWSSPSSTVRRKPMFYEVNDAHHEVVRASDIPLPRNPVCVLALNVVKPFATVYQLVSHIRAHPPPTLDVQDSAAVIEHNHSALHHVLPPGSMTGAPKKRSCEILQQIERRNRGVYSGIIGYMDVGGGCSWSVAIRTAFSSEKEDYIVDRTMDNSEYGDDDGEDMVEIEKRKIWHVGAGGAITVLSNVEGEWEEMMGKMANVLKGFETVKEEYPSWRPE